MRSRSTLLVAILSLVAAGVLAVPLVSEPADPGGWRYPSSTVAVGAVPETPTSVSVPAPPAGHAGAIGDGPADADVAGFTDRGSYNGSPVRPAAGPGDETTTIPANSIVNGVLPVDLSNTLACIRSVESDTAGGYRAVSSDGTYRGAYQFDRATWRSVGGSGDPAAAPPDEQDARAAYLLLARGLAPWPPAKECS